MDQINTQPRSKKWIIIVLVFLALSLLIYAFYFIKTKKQLTFFSEKLPYEISKETESWNTYKNIQYGFEIKYPTNWKAEEPSAYGVNFYPSEVPKLFESDKRYPATIEFNKISDANYPLRSQMDRKKYKLDNGIEIIKFIPTTNDSMLNAIIYVDNKIYQVYVADKVFGQKDTKVSNRAIFDKMLPTLKKLK
jgi:hypothetical protein